MDIVIPVNVYKTDDTNPAVAVFVNESVRKFKAMNDYKEIFLYSGDVVEGHKMNLTIAKLVARHFINAGYFAGVYLPSGYFRYLLISKVPLEGEMGYEFEIIH